MDNVFDILKFQEYCQVFIACLLCAISGGLILQSKGWSFSKGYVWGLFLGIIGVIVTLYYSKKGVDLELDQNIQRKDESPGDYWYRQNYGHRPPKWE